MNFPSVKHDTLVSTSRWWDTFDLLTNEKLQEQEEKRRGGSPSTTSSWIDQQQKISGPTYNRDFQFNFPSPKHESLVSLLLTMK